MLSLQRSAGNRAVSTLMHEAGPLPVQRLFGWGKSKKKSPTAAETLDAGFGAMSGEKGSDQLAALMPFAAQIDALGSKAEITQKIDDTFKGTEPLVREGLKTAVLLSTWTAPKIKGRLDEIGITNGAVSGDQRKAVDKLTKDLAKSAKPELSATYKALYSRCLQAGAGLADERGDDAFSQVQGEAAETTNLRRGVKAVSKISAMSFDMAYSERLLRSREESIAAFEQQGTKPVETVVLGAGPVGMMAAIEAALAGANVHVYEMRRSGPSRSNVLKLTDPTFLKLRKLGVYATLFGPDHTKGDASMAGSHGVSVAYLEDVLRARAAQLGIKVTYGYQLEEITAPKDGKTQTTVRLKKYVPTREGPEMDVYKKMGDAPEYIDALSDLVIGATGAGATTGNKLGLDRERMKDDKGQDLQDFTGVGLFEPDGLPDVAPGTDTLEPGVTRWLIGLRTPKVDYLLTQISRENFIKFKDDKSARNSYIAQRGKDAAKFRGALKESSVFDITLNQAKQFANEQIGGVVIGDEAATPHPYTGSGFNTGAGSTSFVPGLVKGIGRGDRTGAFSEYDKGIKERTDKMIGMGKGYFKGALYQKNKPTSPPPQKTDDDGPAKDGPEPPSFYTPEDIGVTPETEYEYQQAQEKVMALYGMGPRRGYDPEDIGVTPETQARYDEIAARIETLFGGPRKNYLEQD